MKCLSLSESNHLAVVQERIQGQPKNSPGILGQDPRPDRYVRHGPGQQFKIINIHSNDPEQPRLNIKLIFNVIRHLSLDPLTVAMRLPDCDKDAVFPLTANNYWTKPIALKAARSSGSDEVVLVPQEVVVPPGGKADFQFSVRVKRRSGQSHLKGTALIETNDPVEKILPIRYFIQLPQDERLVTRGKIQRHNFDL